MHGGFAGISLHFPGGGFVVAQAFEFDQSTHGRAEDEPVHDWQIFSRGAGRHCEAIENGDAVARLHAGPAGGGAGQHAGDEHAKGMGLTFEEGLEGDTNAAAVNDAVRDEVVCDRLRHRGGNGTAEAASADFVHADDLTIQIHQRAAAVAGKDDRVVPDPAHHFADFFSVDAETVAGEDHVEVGDDAAGHRLGKTCRAAHGEHRVANFE